MTMYPRQPDARFGALLQEFGRRLRRVETRTATIDPGLLLCTRSGTIPASYTSGQATVVLDTTGESTGPWPSLGSYTPAAGDAVLLIPLGQGYVIAGRYS